MASNEGSSGFSQTSTAEVVTQGIDASHLTAIVTGATSGIGTETARVLALRGAKVIMTARNLASGIKVKEELLKENPAAKLEVMEMDLSSLDSVRRFAHAFLSSHQQVHILLNNAGIMACPYELSKDGIELQFATNHIGHFLLTNLLLDTMKSTARETGIQGRIVDVSGGIYILSDGNILDLEKLNDKTRYTPTIAYCHSKLANILHANELASLLKAEGSNITANSLHPGVIKTNLGRHNALIIPVSMMRGHPPPFMKSIPQGAATSCYVALHPNLKEVTGKYFSDCNEGTPSALAQDAELANKLWAFSNELCSEKSQPISSELI